MGPTTYTHTALNCPATTIGPKVRAGFKEPPVIGPAINTPQASANPTASGATPAGALSSVATEMITNIRMKVTSISAKSARMSPTPSVGNVAASAAASRAASP